MTTKFEQTYETLTMKELNIVEQKSGYGIGTMADEAAPKAALMTALAWVVKKREQADFTFEQAEGLTQKEVNGILGLDEDPKEDSS